VNELANTELSTSVFFTVCGIEKNQACVIERTQDEYLIRPMKRGVLAQANHHVGKDFSDLNEPIKVDEGDGTVYNCSKERYDVMREEIQQATTTEEAIACLDVEPVQNEESYQQMMFCPETEEVRVWRGI
jgi:hypothetical protein